MAKAHTFWNRIANFYARQPVADEAAYEEKLRVTRSYFNPDMSVFEFGCGTGTTALKHAGHVKHIRAVDFSAKMIGIAQAKARDAGIENVSFEQAGIDDVEIADGSMDMVMGHSILHLLADRNAAIAKVHRMLKPGGVFVSSTVCLGGRLDFMKYIAPIGQFLGLLPILRIFSPDELRADLTDAGFIIDHDWHPAPKKAVFIVAKKPA